MPTTSQALPDELALVHRQIVDRFGAKRIRVYEAGGGSSSCLAQDILDRSEIVVVDIDATQLEHNQYATTKILGDIETYSFPQNSFDLIVCYNVIEHLHAPDQAIRRFGDALAPMGLLVIGAPDPRSFSGFVTRFTPHWLHVWCYRVLLRSANAGKPGCAPFPVVYHPVVEPTSLVNFAQRLGLRLVLQHRYESPMFRFLEKKTRVGTMIRAITGLLNLFAANGRDFRHGDYHVVLEKPTAPGERTSFGSFAAVSSGMSETPTVLSR
jgi:SAM-dependent methyltransferase